MSEKSKSFLTNLKTISVLLVICLVCGLLLALCNDLLYVDEATKFNRKISKVYKGFERDTSFAEAPASANSSVATLGRINKVYLSKDGTYVLDSTGIGGFSGGSVTMLVAIGGKTPNVQIKGLAMTDNVAQSWAGKVTQSELDKAYVGKNIKDLSTAQFSSAYKLGGTTGTSTAILNSVKMAVDYCVKELKLVSTPESEALDAVKEQLGALAEGYTFANVNDQDYNTALTVGDQALAFYFEGTKADSYDMGVYVYGNKDSGHKVVAVKTGLKHSELVASQTIFATEGLEQEYVDKVKSLGYVEYQYKRYHDAFVYEGEGTVNQDYAEYAPAGTKLGTVTKILPTGGEDGSFILRVVSEQEFGGGQLTIDVIIVNNKIHKWLYVSSSNTEEKYIESMILKKAESLTWYVGLDIVGTPFDSSNYIHAGATISSIAINNAINTARNYAYSIAQAE